MNGLFAFLTLTIILVISQMMEKNIVQWTFLALFIVPSIYVGGNYVNGLYFYSVVFAGMLLIKRRVQLRISKGIAKYVIAASTVMFISLLAWLFNNGNNFPSVVISFLGSLKYVVLAVEIGMLLQPYSKEEVSEGFGVAFRVLFWLNVVAVVGQLVIPSATAHFIDSFFQSSSTTNQVYEYTVNGLSRRTGIYYSPPIFALYSLCSIAYYWSETRNRKSSVVYLFLSIVMGFLSSTKTFILGFSLILAFVLLYETYHMHNKMGIYSVLFVIAVFLVIYMNYDLLYAFIKSKNSNWAYYFSFLKRPLEAFATRYSEGGSAATSYELIREYPIFGVGPIALRGEFLGDSAPVALLHDCGVVGLLICVGFYFKSIVASFITANRESFMFLSIIFVTGLSMTVWLFNPLPFPIMLYALNGLYLNRQDV